MHHPIIGLGRSYDIRLLYSQYDCLFHLETIYLPYYKCELLNRCTVEEDLEIWEEWLTQKEPYHPKTSFFIFRKKGDLYCFEEYDLRKLFKSKYDILDKLFKARSEFVELQIETKKREAKDKEFDLIIDYEVIKQLAFDTTYHKITFISINDLKRISYCPWIWSPYQEIDWKEYSYYDTRDQINAILLELAYKRCLANKEILAYSHRKKGWASPEFKLKEDFSVRFKTNFGFGRSSYFFLILKFRNIEIHSYSKWVYYRYVDEQELISCTRNFKYDDRDTFSSKISNKEKICLMESDNHNKEMTWEDAWREAMKFCCEAINIACFDEIAFVQKYIVDECHRLINGLENIFSTKNANQFEFVVNYSDSEKVFIQHKLIEVKGEKLSGALHFIQSILELKDIMPVNQLVYKIEELNKAVLPNIENTLLQVQGDLIKCNNEFKDVSTKYNQLLPRKELYDNEIKKIKINMAKKHPTFNQDDLSMKSELLLSQQKPEYKLFREKFNPIESLYNDLASKIETLERINSNISMYKQTIQDYFPNNSRNSFILFG